MPGANGDVFHDVVERLPIDRRSIDEQIAVLDPRLVVMPGRGVGSHRDADSARQLAIQVEIGGGVVGAVSDADQLVGIGSDASRGDEARSCGVAVVQPLELLREGCAPLQLESFVSDRLVFRRFKHVDSALVFGTVVLHLDAWRGREKACLSLRACNLFRGVNRCRLGRGNRDGWRVYLGRCPYRGSGGHLACLLASRARRYSNHRERGGENKVSAFHCGPLFLLERCGLRNRFVRSFPTVRRDWKPPRAAPEVPVPPSD